MLKALLFQFNDRKTTKRVAKRFTKRVTKRP
jgi:hypothetical protein